MIVMQHTYHTYLDIRTLVWLAHAMSLGPTRLTAFTPGFNKIYIR